MLKLKSNQIVSKHTVHNGAEVILRTQRMNDPDDMMHYINALVDEQAILSIDEKVSRWEEAKWLRSNISDLKAGKRIAIVAEIGSRVIGNAGVDVLRWRENHFGKLGIGIAKEYRNMGIGELLIRELIRLSRKNGLRLLTIEVFETNAAATRLYKKWVSGDMA